MAETPPAPGSGFGLKRKVGPFPVWGWGLIGTATIFLGWRYYKARKAAAATTTSTTTAVPAANSPYPFISGGYGGGFGAGGFTPAPATTATTSTSTLSTPEGNQAAIPAPALSAPAPTPVPQVPSGIQPSYLAGLGLTPDQISGVLQPQNQPGVNQYVSAAPTQALAPGATLGPATGVGQRFLTPGPNPFPVTYG